MSKLYQLYAFVTEQSWIGFLSDSWPDAPLVNGYRILVFTNQEYPRLKEQYPDFEAKELTAAETIAAIENNEPGPFVHNIEQVKRVINHFTPVEQGLNNV